VWGVEGGKKVRGGSRFGYEGREEKGGCGRNNDIYKKTYLVPVIISTDE